MEQECGRSFQQKTSAVSLKWGKIWPRLLLMTNRIMEIFIYPVFSPKIRKFALRLMETSKGYNWGNVKDRCKMFAPKSGFSGRAS